MTARAAWWRRSTHKLHLFADEDARHTMSGSRRQRDDERSRRQLRGAILAGTVSEMSEADTEN